MTYEEFLNFSVQHKLWLLDESELRSIIHNNKHFSTEEAWMFCFSAHKILDWRTPEMNLQRTRASAREILKAGGKGFTKRDVLTICQRLQIGYKNMPSDKHARDLDLAKDLKEQNHV